MGRVLVCALALFGTAALGNVATAANITDVAAAGTAPASTAITPLQVNTTSITDDSTVVGPQDILIDFLNSYTSTTFPFDLRISISGAAFEGTTGLNVYSKDTNGKLVLATVSGCTRSLGSTGLIFSNCVAGGSAISAFVITGVTYNSASGLATPNRNITISAVVTKKDDQNTVYESAPSTIVATSFSPTTYTLTTATAGSGTGTIALSPTGGSYGSGTVVTLTATANAGSTFTGWSGGCTVTTTTCQVTMDASKTVTATFAAPLHFAGVFSTKQTVTQSFLRLYNASSTAGTANVVLSDSTTGSALASWTSPSIEPGTSRQFSVGEIEGSLTGTKPLYYSATVLPGFSGGAQHVVWDTSVGTLLDRSTCDSQTPQSQRRVINVHSSLVAGYPSTVIVHNTGTAATTATVSVLNATTAQSLGSFTTASIPPNGQLRMTAAELETSATVNPNTNAVTYYIVAVQSGFTGYLTHLVTNTQSGAAVDMTQICATP
jgi:hypothetical protein